MKKVRILFMPPVDAGCLNAQSLNVRELVSRFDPERLESTLWYEKEPDPRLRDREGIRLLRLPSSRKTVRILREQLAGYDLIGYTDCSPATYIFLHLPRTLRKGTATVFHAEGANLRAQLASASTLTRRLYRGILPNCDVHTAITDCVASDMEAMQISSQYILPVGVDLCSFSPPVSRPDSTLTVLFVGTLIERKGPAQVIQAAAHFPHVRFRLVGSARDGYEAVLHRSIAERGLRNVTIEGSKSQQQIAEIMRGSDVLLLPSRLEGMPKVTLEAAATGLPSIVFNDYQTPSVVHGVTGFQVSSFDEMLKSLDTLLQNPELRMRMGTEARRHVQQFDWDAVAKVWLDAYLDIAAKRKQHLRG